MDSKTKNRLIVAARKISLGWKARQAVKKRQKVDKALYECSKCGCYCYEGKSLVAYDNYITKYPEKKVVMERYDIDHIIPAVPLEGWDGWDSFYSRLFCGEENLRGLCFTCHSEKTNREKKKRLAFKYGKGAEKRERNSK